jgi:thioredoxin-related protein
MTGGWTRAVRVGCAAILASCALAASAAGSLPFARDLAADGRDARTSGRVIVVLFGTADCPYCRKVRERFLAPMHASAEEAKRVVVREVEVDSARPVVDFAGRTVTHTELGRTRTTRFVPYVAFLGPQGEPLAEPLVGISSTDLYGGLLERRVETARAKLAGR